MDLGWRPFHIPVRVTRSWFVAVAISVVLFAIGVYPFVLPRPSVALNWLFAVATAAIFFAGLLLHELGHALMARRLGEPVQGITLRALGGVTHSAHQWRPPRRELLVAGAGPAVSLVLSIALLLAVLVAQGHPSLQVLLAWSGLMQLSATAVNLLPRVPLDGGRVLRALVSCGQRGAAALVWGGWALVLGLLLLAMTAVRLV